MSPSMQAGGISCDRLPIMATLSLVRRTETLCRSCLTPLLSPAHSLTKNGYNGNSDHIGENNTFWSASASLGRSINEIFISNMVKDYLLIY